MQTKPNEPIDMSKIIEDANKLTGEIQAQQKLFQRLLKESNPDVKPLDTSALTKQVTSTINQISQNYQKWQKDLEQLGSQLTDIPHVQTSISKMQSSMSKALDMTSKIQQVLQLLSASPIQSQKDTSSAQGPVKPAISVK